MSALQDEIRAAVAAELAELLPKLVSAAIRSAVADLRIGDGGDELLDAYATAKLLGMSPSALRRAEERGRSPIPAIRVGRRLRWRRADVLAFLGQRD